MAVGFPLHAILLLVAAQCSTVLSQFKPLANIDWTMIRNRRLILSHRGYTSMTNNSFNGVIGYDIDVLDLSGNHFDVIVPSAFQHIPDLEELYMTNNQLLRLENSTFVYVPKLRILQLADNFLQSLPVGLFQNLRQLTNVYLKGNSFPNFQPLCDVPNRIMVDDYPSRLTYCNPGEEVGCVAHTFSLTLTCTAKCHLHNPCHGNATCTDPSGTSGKILCQCNHGYHGDGSSCLPKCYLHNPCHVNATCDDSSGSIKCTCKAGLAGDGYKCEDKCAISNPCHASATCNYTSGSSVCSCHRGYTGDGRNCVDMDECCGGFHTCHRQLATCQNTAGSFKCSCNKGYAGNGHQCTEINECASNPCRHGGMCTDAVNNYTCTCGGGFTGANCEIDKDECVLGTYKCGIDFSCRNNPGSYECVCNAGYAKSTLGDFCVVKNFCTSKPPPCKQSGTVSCTPKFNDYDCKCKSNARGKNCSDDIDECFSQPCLNGGRCVNRYHNSYQCICKQGYEGDRCERDINECQRSPCLNQGSCVNELGGFRCICLGGFSGKNCSDSPFVCPNQDDRLYLPGGLTNTPRGNYSQAKQRCHLSGGTLPPSSLLQTCVDNFMKRVTFAWSIWTEAKAHTDVYYVLYKSPKGSASSHASNQHNFVCFSEFRYHDSLTCDPQVQLVFAKTYPRTNFPASQPWPFFGYANQSCSIRGMMMPNEPMLSCLQSFVSFMKRTHPKVSFTGVDHGPWIYLRSKQPSERYVIQSGETQPSSSHFPQYQNRLICARVRQCNSRPCLNGGFCNEVKSGFTCSCPTGFTGTLCGQDIDECAKGTHNCLGNTTCHNNWGSHRCRCQDQFLGNGTHCIAYDSIDECASNPCSQGTCLDGYLGYRCVCNPGYTGGNCSIEIDTCGSNPCQNGAFCDRAINGYTCHGCRGFTGENCDTDVDECSSGLHNCGNNICINLPGRFVCNCPPGSTGNGTHCTEILECASNPCQSKGVCMEGVFGYTCNCSAGYTGVHCIHINECSSNPCANGVCIDKVNEYTCRCFPGYSGVNCDIDIDECNVAGSSPCKNGAVCVDGIGDYTCINCAKGFTGKNCETNIDDCAGSVKCQHGGRCIDGITSYTCACAPGFTGNQCTSDIDECVSGSHNCHVGTQCINEFGSFRCLCSKYQKYLGQFVANSTHCTDLNVNECLSNPCQNNGLCSDHRPGYFCVCRPGFTGQNCSININECASSPCHHSKVCVDGLNSYTCRCDVGLVGDKCEHVAVGAYAYEVCRWTTQLFFAGFAFPRTRPSAVLGCTYSGGTLPVNNVCLTNLMKNFSSNIGVFTSDNDIIRGTQAPLGTQKRMLGVCKREWYRRYSCDKGSLALAVPTFAQINQENHHFQGVINWCRGARMVVPDERMYGCVRKFQIRTTSRADYAPLNGGNYILFPHRTDGIYRRLRYDDNTVGSNNVWEIALKGRILCVETGVNDAHSGYACQTRSPKNYIRFASTDTFRDRAANIQQAENLCRDSGLKMLDEHQSDCLQRFLDLIKFTHPSFATPGRNAGVFIRIQGQARYMDADGRLKPIPAGVYFNGRAMCAGNYYK